MNYKSTFNLRSGKHNTYTVQSNDTSNHVINTGEIMYTIKTLKDGHLYDFWVSATTNTGEGEPSTIISQEPTQKSKKPLFDLTTI